MLKHLQVQNVIIELLKDGKWVMETVIKCDD